MLKNDLVLRGSVGTVELLIFPSNILSKNFQRWNMFYFLWGLFRVSKKDSSNLPSYVSTSRLERNFNDDSRPMDWSTSALSSTHSFSQNRSGFAELGPNLKPDYPEHQDKMRDTFGGNVSERDFDVSMVPVTCSVSLTHLQEESGKVSTTINLNDADKPYGYRALY